MVLDFGFAGVGGLDLGKEFADLDETFAVVLDVVQILLAVLEVRQALGAVWVDADVMGSAGRRA